MTLILYQGNGQTEKKRLANVDIHNMMDISGQHGILMCLHGSLCQNRIEGNDMTNIEAYKWLYEHFAPCGDETKQDAAITKALESLKKQMHQE
jgi:hypothetical protein